MLENTPTPRREFLKQSLAAAGGFVVAFHWPLGGKLAWAAEGEKYPANAFVRIAPDNSITITINKIEMGQGVYTSLAQLLAEELECDWKAIRCESAKVDPVYNGTMMPTQITGGSSSVKTTYEQYRRIGAVMRTMLIQAAARRWGVSEESCRAAGGFVLNADQKLSYGELADAAAKLPFPAAVSLKKKSDFKIIGQSNPRVDAYDKSRGQAEFGLDVRLPGMLYAVIARPPVRGAKLLGLKDDAARAVPGVSDVVRFGSDSVAVLGRNTWAAWKGRDALELRWDMQGQDGLSSESLTRDFRAELDKPGASCDKRGDAETALAQAKHHLIAEYEFPYLAHAAMEPLNCTIRYDGSSAELWGGHQAPTWDRDAAAAILGLPKDKVQVHTTYAGGGFGRRGNKNSDFAAEAAQLAKVVKKPLKVVWTRPDDMQGGYYRPYTMHRAELGFDASGKLVGWKHRIAGQRVAGESPLAQMMMKDGYERLVVEGVAGTPYELKNFSCEVSHPTPNMTTSWWRSVGHTHTGYVTETLIDEIAHHAKRDPLALRKELLKNSPRHLAVLELLEKKSGWGKAKPAKGHAFGLAVHESFDSVVGHVVDVSYHNGQARLHRVISAVDCGLVVNPDGATAQVESAIVYGLSAALYGEIKIDKGRATTTNFHEYPVARMPEMPQVEVYFVEGENAPTGLGEPGLPPLAPAMANALFRLTGKRIRRLPFSKGLA